ncbi:MAG: carboxypeptidase M32 [Pirellulaceae bacterium]
METNLLFKKTCDHYRECGVLQSIGAILEWDEQTMAPAKASAYRAEQVACIARTLHRLRTLDKVGDWVQTLVDSDLASDPRSQSGSTIRNFARDFTRQKKLPESLVEAISKQAVIGQQAWVQARKESDFSSFAPHLERILRLKREEADAVGFSDERYDALLDDYEPGATTADVEKVLGGLKQQLVPLVRQILDSKKKPDRSIVCRPLSVSCQRRLGISAAELLGFDFQRGRLDTSTHPFSTELGPDDCRITTRYDEDFYLWSFFGTLHEVGHGMYEQGLKPDQYGLPLGKYASLGIHESQSRLWENLVGRSRSFWEFFYPKFQEHHPDLGNVSLDAFYFAVNDVQASPIRVEADEVTYNLHIIIRFELERQLLDERLAVSDLPQAWNEMYDELLGIRPVDDAKGVLQDVHWSAGLIGYFPTYTLGNLYAAQLFAAAEKDTGNLADMFRVGEFAPLLGWMRENVHQQGRRLGSVELVEDVTGEAPDARYLMDHLRRKLLPLYT